MYYEDFVCISANSYVLSDSRSGRGSRAELETLAGRSNQVDGGDAACRTLSVTSHRLPMLAHAGWDLGAVRSVHRQARTKKPADNASRFRVPGSVTQQAFAFVASRTQ